MHRGPQVALCPRYLVELVIFDVPFVTFVAFIAFVQYILCPLVYLDPSAVILEVLYPNLYKLPSACDWHCLLCCICMQPNYIHAYLTVNCNQNFGPGFIQYLPTRYTTIRSVSLVWRAPASFLVSYQLFPKDSV